MSLQLIGTNQTNSTLLAYDGNIQQINFYSSFGNVNSVQNGQLPGFNGERPDPFTGVSHLGNGYRAYNPVLMRFNSPDNASSFGAGGINPYAYCENDPLNFTDPSGHGIIRLAVRALRFVFKIVKFLVKVIAKTSHIISGISVLGKIVTGVAAIGEAPKNPEAAVKLAHASSAFGWINAGASFIAGLDDIYGSVRQFKESRRFNKEESEVLSESITGIDELGADNESLAREASETGRELSHSSEHLENNIESAPEKSVRRQQWPPMDRTDVEYFSLMVLQVLQSTTHTASLALKSASSVMKKKNPEMSDKLKISSMILEEVRLISFAPKTIRALKKAVKHEQAMISVLNGTYTSEQMSVNAGAYLLKYTKFNTE